MAHPSADQATIDLLHGSRRLPGIERPQFSTGGTILACLKVGSLMVQTAPANVLECFVLGWREGIFGGRVKPSNGSRGPLPVSRKGLIVIQLSRPLGEFGPPSGGIRHKPDSIFEEPSLGRKLYPGNAITPNCLRSCRYLALANDREQNGCSMTQYYGGRLLSGELTNEFPVP